MAKKKADKVINQCRDPEDRHRAARAASALDLNDGQVYLLAELWASQGGDLADRCYSLFQFRPTAEDRAHLYWTLSLHAEWADWLEGARIGWGNWKARRHERGEYPVSVKHPPRRGEPGWVNFDDRRRFTFTPTETSA